ncbi:MAG: spiro-SPASM protein [Treponema sp.]|nr:spiro-SPASM protein [Treponema sp.]
MNSLLVLYSPPLSKYAFQPIFDGKNAVALAVERGRKFPGVGKIVLLASELGDGNSDFSFLSGEEVTIEQRQNWTKKSLLERISELQTGFDLTYFAFADCPFLDPVLAGSLARRHLDYKADYAYADGWPFGVAPEILAPGTAGICAKILDKDAPVENNVLFSVIEKDINSFDIEVEISKIDLSSHRLNLRADSKRNFMLLNNFFAANDKKIPCAADIETIIEEKPEILRTLPNYFSVQVYGGCPALCKICPYPLFTDAKNRNDFMNVEKFKLLLDNIIDFTGDAVINLSLWGELSFHPEKLQLIKSVIEKNELTLIVETSGLGWKNEELEEIASFCKETLIKTKTRINSLPPVSWIVSLDTADAQKYSELRGAGFADAESCAKKLLALFPNDCYVQSVRVKGSEDDTERFYRFWKEAAPNGEKNIIIQKYDDFCGQMEKKQASDISPIIRQCCWHIMRDMPILIDGSVLLCREYLASLKGEKDLVLGNVFNDSLETIWQNGNRFYIEQCKKNYDETLFHGLCVDCDEYYTYNF